MNPRVICKNVDVIPCHACASTEGGRGIARIHSQSGTRKRWIVSATFRPLYPLEIPGTYCTGGWMGLKTDLDGTENLTPPGFDPPTAQPAASPCTDCAGPAARVIDEFGCLWLKWNCVFLWTVTNSWRRSLPRKLTVFGTIYIYICICIYIYTHIFCICIKSANNHQRVSLSEVLLAANEVCLL
jgi:hypothetical protein